MQCTLAAYSNLESGRYISRVGRASISTVPTVPTFSLSTYGTLHTQGQVAVLRSELVMLYEDVREANIKWQFRPISARPYCS